MNDADWYCGAVLSVDRMYRYRLWRRWSQGFPTAYWIMLNPSTADERKDDATIRRCVNFSRRWGCGAMEVVNLFAFRATNPRHLFETSDPIGPNNDQILRNVAPESSDLVIAAWGAFPRYLGDRDKAVYELLRRHDKAILCLGMTMEGYPRHPVRLANNTNLEEFMAGERCGDGAKRDALPNSAVEAAPREQTPRKSITVNSCLLTSMKHSCPADHVRRGAREGRRQPATQRD